MFEPSEKGPKGLVTQVPSKKYAGLYIFQSVYGHLIGDGFVFKTEKLNRKKNSENLVFRVLEKRIHHENVIHSWTH